MEAKPVVGRPVDQTDGPDWTSFLEGFSPAELSELLKINIVSKVQYSKLLVHIYRKSAVVGGKKFQLNTPLSVTIICKKLCLLYIMVRGTGYL